MNNRKGIKKVNDEQNNIAIDNEDMPGRDHYKTKRKRKHRTDKINRKYRFACTPEYVTIYTQYK